MHTGGFGGCTYVRGSYEGVSSYAGGKQGSQISLGSQITLGIVSKEKINKK